MRWTCLFACLAALSLARAAAAAPTLETDEQKTLYALGASLARNLAPFGLTPQEIEILATGLTDAASGREPRVDLEVYGRRIDALAAQRRQRFAAREREASQGFLDAAAAESGARRLPSGLVFRETRAGSGPAPQATDKVRVHYHGTLRDGTVFDSSRERGTPAEFPLNRVIPCWTEGLQLMHVGSQATLLCPAAIAYGDRGAGRIPPGATLRFDVELIEIVAP
jgi:FKBP-type peptidyl-prolyl cis-trans isomerase FkpA